MLAEKRLVHRVNVRILEKILGGYLKKPFYKWADKTTYEVLKSLTKNETLIKVLSGQYGDYGLAPKQSSFYMHASVARHYFDGGNCIGRFPLATNEVYTNKQTNERVTNTEWHNIVVRNKAAEICEKYLSKGDKVYIEGRLKTRKWQDDKGQDRYSTEIHCTEFTFLNNRNDNSESVGQSTSPSTKPAQSDLADTNDDLPF